MICFVCYFLNQWTQSDEYIVPYPLFPAWDTRNMPQVPTGGTLSPRISWVICPAPLPSQVDTKITKKKKKEWIARPGTFLPNTDPRYDGSKSLFSMPPIYQGNSDFLERCERSPCVWYSSFSTSLLFSLHSNTPGIIYPNHVLGHKLGFSSVFWGNYAETTIEISL